jgi:hypothetical protein
MECAVFVSRYTVVVVLTAVAVDVEQVVVPVGTMREDGKEDCLNAACCELGFTKAA